MAYDAKFRGYQPAANWTAENPVLEQFTFGYETDTGKAKLGDGLTAWNSLGYWNPGEGNVKRYRALLTQTGIDAPVATVLENTLGGEVVWSRHAEGAYNATLADVFTANKTLLPGRTVLVDPTSTVAMAGERVSASVLRFTIVRWHWEDLTTQSMSVYELSEAVATYPNHIWDVEILVYP